MKEIFEVINSMAPYLLLGFLLAGMMHAFIPSNLYRKYLGGNSLRSVLHASLLGIPLPLCSCGVIPTAMSLRKEGASKAATVSFLISTPPTGVDSIFATYSLMGLPFALLRPLIALVTSVIGGILVNKLDTDTATGIQSDSSCPAEKASLSFAQKIRKMFHYAFVEMMQDIGKWLVIGLVVAGLITVFVPDSFFALFADKPLLSMLLVLAFSIPMYLCATGSIPIAVALMLKGLSPGTALVLLMAGPAVNVASMLVIHKVMGRKTLLIYISSIVACSILFGLGIDYFLPREWFAAPLEQIHLACGQGISYFNVACFALLVGLLCNAFIQKYRTPKACGQACECHLPEQEKFEFTVKGMNCMHCRANVEKALWKVNGAEQVQVDLASGTAVVFGKINKEEAVQSVESLGFKAIADIDISNKMK